jgi:hypothetical protein
MIDQASNMAGWRVAWLRWSISAFLSCVCTVIVSTTGFAAGKAKLSPPEIFFIGDSHLSFGAGKAFQSFFKNFEKHCMADEDWMGQARAIAMRRFGLMGVKSTALYHWVSRSRTYKKMVCEPDPKWPVNARLYGFKHRTDGSYVQLGRDPSFPFCRKDKSPLEAVFDWAKPRLLILYFTGNTIERWANSKKPAQLDAKRLMKQLPKNTGCVFMTTSPVYHASHNKLRVKAQKNIAAAFAKYGNRCRFVPMLTPETVSAIEGKASYFRRHKNGRVKDPYHPGPAASRLLLKLQRKPFCRAVLNAMRPNLLATLR